MSALAGKVAWVTGSSRGIGAAVARLFAAEGASVAVHGRDPVALAAIRADIERAGGRVLGVVGDVTRLADVEAMRRRIEEGLGPVDLLVANAGSSYTPPGPLEEVSEEGWHASIDGNLTSTFLTLKSVLPGMQQRRAGSVVTISSAAGRRPHPRSPIPYAAAKAALEILTQDVAAQAGPFGIRVNCIGPETILTERNRERIPEPQRAALIEQHPIRRLGTPEDVARAALFLASDDSGWITGVVLDVAGGATMLRWSAHLRERLPQRLQRLVGRPAGTRRAKGNEARGAQLGAESPATSAGPRARRSSATGGWSPAAALAWRFRHLGPPARHRAATRRPERALGGILRSKHAPRSPTPSTTGGYP